MTQASPTPPPDWAAVRALFEQLLALPAAQRNAALDAATAPAAVRAEVRSLLAHAAGDDDSFLALPAVTELAPALPPQADRLGQRLGPWRITGLLGRGGMGEVWAAQRDDGAYAGRAAVKVLRHGMDSATVLARFAQEQRTLARLNHPHIAHLLDAGRTADGLPYFVMEAVDGQPIDRACAGRPLEQRLALFLQLADAVAHAHRQLLVHRDLKPSNVLVSADGQVKLLDFGIAKALDPLEGHDGATTVTGERPFTPHYASPEQVRGEPVGTGTDLYSLGVLLYVMLTGVRPYGRSASSAQEAARSVLEESPTRPSALSPGLVDDPQWLATRKRLVGDLDNILLKALDKDAAGRYPSVDALAADLRAFLAGLPVSARAATPAYLLAKLVARNRLATAALGLALVCLVGGLGASLWQGRAAAQARDEARRQLAGVKQITSELVFRFGDAISLLPGGAQSQEAMLQQTLAALDAALANAPDDPDLLVLVASALGRLAQIQGNPSFAGPERASEAQATVARALALGDRVWDSRHGDWRFASQHLITLMTQAQLLRGQGQPAPGLAVLARAHARSGQALAAPGVGDEGRANLLELRANIAVNQAHFNDHVGRPSLGLPAQALLHYAQAEADFRALYADPALMAAMRRHATPGDPPVEEWANHNTANVLSGRALVHQRLADDAAMRRDIEAALALREDNLRRNAASVTWRQSLMFDLNTLAIALLRQHDEAAALPVSQRAWDLAGALVHEAGPGSAWAHTRASFAPQYGRALLAAGRADQALPVVDLGLARLAQQRQQADSALLRLRQAMLQVLRGRVLLAQGQRAAGLALLPPAVTALQALVDDARLGREARLGLAEAQALQAGGVPALVGSRPAR